VCALRSGGECLIYLYRRGVRLDLCKGAQEDNERVVARMRNDSINGCAKALVPSNCSNQYTILLRRALLTRLIYEVP
jgi:hypothetical protein